MKNLRGVSAIQSEMVSIKDSTIYCVSKEHSSTASMTITVMHSSLVHGTLDGLHDERVELFRQRVVKCNITIFFEHFMHLRLDQIRRSSKHAGNCGHDEPRVLCDWPSEEKAGTQQPRYYQALTEGVGNTGLSSSHKPIEPIQLWRRVPNNTGILCSRMR